MRPGEPTTEHGSVGRLYRERFPAVTPAEVGVCVSVTPWGSNRIRWVRLRFYDGREKSFPPSHIVRVKEEGET